MGAVRRLACLGLRFVLRGRKRCCWEHKAEVLSAKVRNVIMIDCIFKRLLQHVYLTCSFKILTLAPLPWSGRIFIFSL